MPNARSIRAAFFLGAALLWLTGCGGAAADATTETEGFVLVEATITDVHRAFEEGTLSCHQLVAAYLKRIETYDQPTALNAIVVTNPNALAEAEAMDEEYRSTGDLRPLHCVPLIVKDNYETEGLQTAAGSQALQGVLPADDAYQVRVLKEAGALVLAKSNMAEWAFSPYQTISSIAGTTLNPYALDRVPAGSSGGTAAAVAANFGAVGLGTDTGNSIRGPSSHASLVGIRSTIGATSRDGIVPLYLRNDVGGPMARTVEDAARIFQVIAGPDPADPITEASRGQLPDDYLSSLDPDGLRGARLGVLRALSDTPTADSAVQALFEQALRDLEAQGATLVDPFVIPDFDTLRIDQWCNTFRHDVDAYLASLGDAAPVKNLAEVVASGQYAPYIEERLHDALAVEGTPAEQDPPCLGVEDTPRRAAFRDAVLGAMEADNVDAVVYPSWSNPPRPVGDLESPHGNNSPVLAPHTGQPSLTVPMGYTYGSLPAGLQFLGLPFGEPDLIKYAYAYEQATQHRRPPALFPPLPQVTTGPLGSQEPPASLESCKPLLGLYRLDPVSGLPASWIIRDVRGAGSPEFEVLTGEDGPVLRVTSRNEAVFAYRLIDSPLREEGNLLRWRWRTRTPIPGADLRDKSKDDSPLRLFLVFSTKPIREGRLLRDGQALFYSWGNLEPVGSRFASHVSDELAVWVLRNAVEADGEWREEARDPFDDYRAFFDAEPPPIHAIGVLPDTDQTGAETVTELVGLCWGAP